MVACVLAVAVAFGMRAVFRCAVKLMPGQAVVAQTHVTRLWSARGCRVGVDYTDPTTSGQVSSCMEFAPGKRWIGEPMTVHESVGLFGAKLIRLSFNDV